MLILELQDSRAVNEMMDLQWMLSSPSMTRTPGLPIPQLQNWEAAFFQETLWHFTESASHGGETRSLS